MAKQTVDITSQCSSETLNILSAKYVKSGKNIVMSLNLSGGVNGISRTRHTVNIPIYFNINEAISISTVGNLNTEGTSNTSALAVPCFIQYYTVYLDAAYAYGNPYSFFNQDVSSGKINLISVMIVGILDS